MLVSHLGNQAWDREEAAFLKAKGHKEKDKLSLSTSSTSRHTRGEEGGRGRSWVHLQTVLSGGGGGGQSLLEVM